MGWTFAHYDIGRKAHIEQLTSQAHFGPSYTPLEHRVCGNHIWQLVRQESTGRKFITLDLIAKERNGGWGYKSMDETWGPHFYDCPLSLIEKADPPMDERAAAWRTAVQVHHRDRKAALRRTWEAGMRIEFGGREYRLHSPAGTRRGWYATGPGGGMYRFGTSHLSRAKVINTQESKHAEQ